MKIGTNRLKQRGKKTLTFLFLILTLTLTLTFVSYAGIAGTKHDLSAGGGQAIRAQTETQKCVFCHTPHHSSTVGPLWNRALSEAVYKVPTTAEKPYLLTVVQQPDKSSKLCLGCHDGTVAIGQLLNVPGPGMGGTVEMTDSGTGLLTVEGKLSSTSLAYLGTDISYKHPVSIAVNNELITAKANRCSTPDPPQFKVRWPDSGSPIKLKTTGNTYGGQPGCSGLGVQCRSCHDPHNNPYGKFVVVDYYANSDDLCLACHSYCSEATIPCP